MGDETYIEERGGRRGSPKGTASNGVNLEAAAGRDLPKKALLGLRSVGVDGGGGDVVDGGGDSRPSATMTRDASTEERRLAVLSACWWWLSCLVLSLQVLLYGCAC